MITLPSNRQWLQINNSDSLGSLLGSFNLDLTKVVGNMRFTRTLTTTSGLAGTPVGFEYLYGSTGTNGIYTVAGTTIYLTASNTPSANFTADIQTNVPATANSLYSDLKVFNGYLYVTTTEGGSSQLWKLNTTWSANITTLGSQSFTHMMCTYSDKLYITSGNVIYKCTTADSISSALTLPANERITSIKSSSNRIWIATMNLALQRANIYEWDGAATQVTRPYMLDTTGAFALVIKDDVPYAMDANGRLLVYTTGSFKEIARLPFGDVIPANNMNSQNNRYIHPNGMSVVNGNINILINNILGDSSSSIPEFCPSGVWEYTPSNGLYHKYSASYTPTGSNTVTDYGQNRISVAGGLSEMKITDSSAGQTGNLLVGATVYTNASATSSCIFTNDTFSSISGTTGQYATPGFGYFVTPRLYGGSIASNWQRVWLRYKKFLSSADKIIIKYRTSISNPMEATITWTSTNTFTTTSDVTGYIGGEVEILQGVGAGKSAQMTSLGILDDTFSGATGTAKARFQMWKKSAEISNQTKEAADFSIIGTSNWVQLKICFQFVGSDEIYDLHLTNTNQINI